MSAPIYTNQSLDRIYINFLENMCKQSGKPEMAKPLIEGFYAYQNALCEGIGLDTIKRVGRNVIDFTKGFIHGVLPGAACLVLPWIPIEAVNYGKKLYDRYKVDQEYAIKLGELNKAVNYMNNIEIKVPKSIANKADGRYGWSQDILSTLEDDARMTESIIGDCIIHLNDTNGPHYDACETAHYITTARHKLADDTKNALLYLTKCLQKTDTDKSYECKERTLDDIDEATQLINEDNKHLHQLLVTYSNQIAERAKIIAQKQGDSSSVGGDMVNAKMTDDRYDIPEWVTDKKATCDTISYGPGHGARWEKCVNDLWQ